MMIEMGTLLSWSVLRKCTYQRPWERKQAEVLLDSYLTVDRGGCLPMIQISL